MVCSFCLVFCVLCLLVGWRIVVLGFGVGVNYGCFVCCCWLVR